MPYSEMTAQAFTDVLASKEPVPGGGGASSLVGAIGTPGSVDIGYSMNIIEYVLADYADENWSTTAK